MTIREMSFSIKKMFKLTHKDLTPKIIHLNLIPDSTRKIWFSVTFCCLGLDHHLGSFPRLWAANILLGIAHQSHSLRSVSEDPHWPVQCFQQQSKPSVGAMNKEHTLDGKKMHFLLSANRHAVQGQESCGLAPPIPISDSLPDREM